MKIAIVQGVVHAKQLNYEEPKNISWMSNEEFYSTYINNTKAWAKRMGYDYYLFNNVIKPKRLLDSSANYLNRCDLRTQLFVYRYWWLKKVAQDYDLICWIDSDVGIMGNPDILSFCVTDKLNVATARRTLQYLNWSCEVPDGWFSCMSPERLNHFTDWIENVLTDKSAQSDLLTTLITILGNPHDEHLLTCYHEEGNAHHINFIDLPNDSLKIVRRDDEIVESLTQDAIVHFSGSDKLRMGKLFTTYVTYLKYLKASKKRNSSIRHTITKFSNEELDELYSITKSKLKELTE